MPPDLDAVEDIDVDLQLVPADAPGTVRGPDVIVVPPPLRGTSTEPFPVEIDLDALV